MGILRCPPLHELNEMGHDPSAWRAYRETVISLGGTVSPITLAAPRWAAIFGEDHDAHWLVSGASIGFDFNFVPPASSESVPNYVPDEFEHKVSAKFFEELYFGRVVRTSNQEGHPTVAIGVVDKDHSNFASIRIVCDMSRPHGTSINDCTIIPKIKMATVKQAFAYMRPHGYMAKIDLSNAYRSVPMHARLWPFHIYDWFGDTLMDLRMMFGHTEAPSAFTRITEAIVRHMRKLGFPGVIGYLDDFIVLAHTEAECKKAHDTLIELMEFLGFELNPKKVEGPRQSIIFLGILLETNADGEGLLKASIDEDRVNKVVTMCKQMRSKAFVSKTELERAVGLLNFCTQVIWGSRLYMRSLYAMLHSMPHGKWGGMVLTRSAALDLKFWTTIMHRFNGRGVILNRREIHSDFFAVDASTGDGMGGYLDGMYFGFSWEEVAAWDQREFFPFKSEETSHINFLELFVIWYAFSRWGQYLAGQTVVILSDNVTSEVYARELWGRTTFIPLLKQIFLLCVKFDIRIMTERIDTKANTIADALSRGDWKRFAMDVGLGAGYAKALARRDPVALQTLKELWKAEARNVKDFDDWKLSEGEFETLDVEFGPFSLDGAADKHGSNKQCLDFWSVEKSALHQEWGGLNVYCNPPYSLIFQFLRRFMQCKTAKPEGTTAVFILPVWGTQVYWDLITAHPKVFEIVRRWRAGTALFTSPNVEGTQRKYCGETKWPVVAIRIPPTALDAEIDMEMWNAKFEASPEFTE